MIKDVVPYIKEQCLKAGMDAHIAKPIEIAILEKTLHKVLQ